MKRLFRRLCLLLLVPVLAAGSVAARDLRTPHCLEVCPRERDDAHARDAVIIVRAAYTIDADPETRFARWVAYKVTAETMAANRPRQWAADPALVEAATLEPEDYRDANRTLRVDRGHLAPLASLGGVADWESLNYLSNITPQQSDLNRGPWERLESAERRLVRSGDVARVYVETGPLYERPMPALPGADEPHRVPSGYWKVISIEGAQGIERVAFIFDQESPLKMPFCDGRVSLREVERRAGLAFSPAGGGIALLAHSGALGTGDLAKRLGCDDPKHP